MERDERSLLRLLWEDGDRYAGGIFLIVVALVGAFLLGRHTALPAERATPSTHSQLAPTAGMAADPVCSAQGEDALPVAKSATAEENSIGNFEDPPHARVEPASVPESIPASSPAPAVPIRWAHSTSPTRTSSITVYVTRSGSKYHSAGCRYLSKSMIPISLEEARARYSPCSRCSPP